uniref:CCHC-type domain-containing protein n=1 Tax=Brassica oleracea var. oleracea TaxID=109376 RepID=A0A0D3CPF1_BRAOL
NIDVKVEDEDAALILLVSLPNFYENFVQSFIGSKDTVSLELVRSALHSRELRHKASGSGTDDQASGLFVGGGKNFGKCKKSKDKRSFSNGPKPTDICNYCNEKGHWKSDCPKKKKHSPEVRKEDMDKLWHMRFGHMGERGMQILLKHDLLCGHKTKSLETSGPMGHLTSEFDGTSEQRESLVHLYSEHEEVHYGTSNYGGFKSRWRFVE